MVRTTAPATDLGFLAAALDEADAAAFVHVGDRFDDDMRYLTRFAGPDRDYAFVCDGDRAVLCAPALFDDQAEREFSEQTGDGLAREVRTDDVADPAGLRAATVLAELVGDDGDDGDVLAPRYLPHDAARYLEQAGYELASTTAVADARERKTDAEVDCLRAVQRATVRGMARAEEILAESEAVDGEVHWQDVPLSTERLRRQVNATLAAEGVRDAGNTVIGAGPSAADLHFTGLDEIRAGETVLLDVSPRGPHGYYGDCTRTFVVGGNGGWERRAYVACEAAREAALAHLRPGERADRVHEEAAAELGAHGFRVDSDEVGFTHGVGHGVGVSLHEGPSLTGDATLEPGHVVTIEPGVYDPERGGVRIEDLAVVTEEGYELLAEYPRSLVPERR